MTDDNLLKSNLDPVVLAALSHAKHSKRIRAISNPKSRAIAKNEIARQANRSRIQLDIRPEILELLSIIAGDYGVSISGLISLSILVLANEIMEGLDLNPGLINANGPKFRHKIKTDNLLDQEKIIFYFKGHPLQ